MRKLLAAIACLLLLAAPAHAQKTPAALVSEVNLNLADNTTGLITPAILRTTLNDIVNSIISILSTPAFQGQISSTLGAPTITSGQCGAGANGTVVTAVDQSGLINIGASATTSCIVIFVPALAVTPDACILFPQNAAAAATGTTVARVATVTEGGFNLVGSALANANYWFHCY